MRHLCNPWRGTGLSRPALDAVPWPEAAADRRQALLDRCRRARVTPAAGRAGLAALHLKDECARMRPGSFKALGAANVIANAAGAGRARGRADVAARAGNHGLSRAAGATAFGAAARIFLSDTVPEGLAARLRAQGARVVRAGATCEESMGAARAAACDTGAILLSDRSWPDHLARPHLLMEGYTILMAEAVRQVPAPPTHIVLQAGTDATAAHGLATTPSGAPVAIIPSIGAALMRRTAASTR